MLKLRWKRRRLLYRSWKKRSELSLIVNRTPNISKNDILGFSTVRNEIQRLPFFLDYHRALGVGHFFFVDNDSDDGTAEYLLQQTDVSLWGTKHSYKASRFGVDWLTYLQMRYAHGHWALTLDADEILILPKSDGANLRDLTTWLRQNKFRSFGAIMLDMYPDGPLGGQTYKAGDPIWDVLTHFDRAEYSHTWQEKYQNISIRGGPRKRMFFKSVPDHAPHLHKIPLVDWRRGYAYVSSTHIALPIKINSALHTHFQGPTGALLHSKFLPEVIKKSQSEKHRAEHFTHPDRYDTYYDSIVSGLSFMSDVSEKYQGPEQLESLGLIKKGRWS